MFKMQFSQWQKELLEKLSQKGLSREDIFSVMLVLTREEKGREMLRFLENENLDAEAICQKAGEIAFSENA